MPPEPPGDRPLASEAASWRDEPPDWVWVTREQLMLAFSVSHDKFNKLRKSTGFPSRRADRKYNFAEVKDYCREHNMPCYHRRIPQVARGVEELKVAQRELEKLARDEDLGRQHAYSFDNE